MRRPKSPPKVHNQATYVNHGCRCDVCTAAATAEQQRRRLDRRAARLATEADGRIHIVDGITHGEGGYGYWHCRCVVCRTAHNTNTARRAARRRVVEQ